MTWLPSTLFPTLSSQTLRFVFLVLQTVRRWGLATVMTVFGGLSFQLLDPNVCLLKTSERFGQVVVQDLLLGNVFF